MLTRKDAETLARRHSATARKEARRDVRNALGVSHDAAPQATQTLRAARALSTILDYATDGRFSIAVHDGQQGRSIPIGEAHAIILDLLTVAE
jgi:hypothetical protein